MAKRNLTIARRKDIMDHLEFVVKKSSFPEQRKALDDHMATMRDCGARLVLGLYPLKDMKVMEKYQSASNQTELFFSIYKDGRYNCTFGVPLIKSMLTIYNQRYKAVEISDDHSFAQLQSKRKAMEENLEACEKNLIHDYGTIMDSHKNFDELIKIIPEVEQLGDEIFPPSNQLSVLSDDLMKRVKKDIAERDRALLLAA